ncbi:MAG: hypothetical protein ACYC8T_36865 [Myxococcaceae bacterium]
MSSTPQPSAQLDRREKRRLPLYLSRRRYPRVFLDADWFIEADGCSTLGRGLEISPRGAYLPVARTTDLTSNVTLFVNLPGRARLFKAKGVASARTGPRGWVIRFHGVSGEDLTFLGGALIAEAGLAALPGLDRKYQRFTGLPQRYLRTSK